MKHAYDSWRENEENKMTFEKVAQPGFELGDNLNYGARLHETQRSIYVLAVNTRSTMGEPIRTQHGHVHEPITMQP